MKRKPKKWFIYTRLALVFMVIFSFGATTKAVSSVLLSSDNSNDDKKLSQAVIIENKEELYVEENPVLNKYLSVPEKGFVVTNTNQKYTIPEDQYNFFLSVVASESHTDPNDILAVMSVILNRADSSGVSPVDVVTRPGQFSGYLDGYYLRYLDENGKLIDSVSIVEDVVSDALNGVRNNNYYGFRSWWVESYSDNYISWGGNRFN